MVDGWTMPTTPEVRRIEPADEHERQKWYVLEAYIDGCPAVTKRVSISVSRLVTRPELLEMARTKLIADVTEYYANFLALQNL